MTASDKYAARILGLEHDIQVANHAIELIAKEAIPDFHFLDHRVSTFWTCEKSPIGMCVFLIGERGFHNDCVCRYCGGPVERK